MHALVDVLTENVEPTGATKAMVDVMDGLSGTISGSGNAKVVELDVRNEGRQLKYRKERPAKEWMRLDR